MTARTMTRRCWLSGVLLTPTIVTGCRPTETPPAPVAAAMPVPRGLEIGQRCRIEPVHSPLGVTGRSILACPAGYCVILHYPPSPVEVEDLTSVLEADPATSEDDGETYQEVGNRWCQASADELSRNTFNCCTFAVGDVARLTPHDWIRPLPSGDTYFTSPMQVLLDSYFRELKTYRAAPFPWNSMARDDALHTDDVLCFVSSGPEYTTYSHVGKIWKRGGSNWLLSKFGAGPILRTTIEAAGTKFHGQFDQIRVYRAAL